MFPFLTKLIFLFFHDILKPLLDYFLNIVYLVFREFLKPIFEVLIKIFYLVFKEALKKWVGEFRFKKKIDLKDPKFRRDLIRALAHYRRIPYDSLRLESNVVLTGREQKYLTHVLKRLKAKEPLTKIIEQTSFYGFHFRVTKNVLDPRIDSEVLIDVFQDLYKDKNAKLRILDLGTGSGCLLLTLLKLYPNASGVGIDLSKKALIVAKENAASLNVLERVDLRQGSWFEPLKQTDLFDCVISNPPYIRNDYPLDTSVSDFDPHLALFGGDDGLDAYKIISANVHQYLKGYFIMEIGFDQGDPVKKLICDNKALSYIKCTKDYAHHDRAIISKVK